MVPPNTEGPAGHCGIHRTSFRLGIPRGANGTLAGAKAMRRKEADQMGHNRDKEAMDRYCIAAKVIVGRTDPLRFRPGNPPRIFQSVRCPLCTCTSRALVCLLCPHRFGTALAPLGSGTGYPMQHRAEENPRSLRHEENQSQNLVRGTHTRVTGGTKQREEMKPPLSAHHPGTAQDITWVSGLPVV